MRFKILFFKIFISFSILLHLTCKSQEEPQQARSHEITVDTAIKIAKAVLDTALYNEKYKVISNNDSLGRWPVTAPYPKAGAILPFKRIVAYYGNFYSKRMGILGELREDQMIAKLKSELLKWEQADTAFPVVPALHYIAVTAQASPGRDSLYCLRMPFTQIDKAITIAKKINALVFLDVQIGKSTVQREIPLLKKYLSMSEVHLGIDPEFSMKRGAQPGSEIGTLDAADINYVSGYLAELVKKYNLPPKILVVHRFTKGMVTNYKFIKTLPEVQFVMDMDGWGSAVRKKYTYKEFIYKEPVQFSGFKIFYKNDTKRVSERDVMQPADILELTPRPSYIQYQ